MLAHSVVAAVSDRRRRSEIDATIRARGERRYGQCAGTYVVLYSTIAVCVAEFRDYGWGLYLAVLVFWLWYLRWVLEKREERRLKPM